MALGNSVLRRYSHPGVDHHAREFDDLGHTGLFRRVNCVRLLLTDRRVVGRQQKERVAPCTTGLDSRRIGNTSGHQGNIASERLTRPIRFADNAAKIHAFRASSWTTYFPVVPVAPIIAIMSFSSDKFQNPERQSRNVGHDHQDGD